MTVPDHEQHARHARETISKRKPINVKPGVETRMIELLEANVEATLAVYQLLREQHEPDRDR